MTVSSRALGVLSDGCAQRSRRRTRWRKLSAGRQALLVVAYLGKGETYADPACGFDVGTSSVYRHIREALELLAAMSPTLEQAVEVASRKASLILDGTLLRIDRVVWLGLRPGVLLRQAHVPWVERAGRRGPHRPARPDLSAAARLPARHGGGPRIGDHRRPH
jgi:hypothetical protein